MLIDTTGTLGDKRLSGEEALLRSFENTDAMLQRYRLDDHEHLKDADARTGRPMLHTELISRVTRLNGRVWAEDSLNAAGNVGFYHNKGGVKSYICAFEKGALPEYTIIFTDCADLPVKQKQGWRNILLRLLGAGVLTWAQVLDIFGDAHGCNAQRWKFYTRKYRN
jgi:hypothetical protein